MVRFASLIEIWGPDKGHWYDERERGANLCLLLSLLGQEDRLDVGQHTTLGNGHAGEQFVQLLVVADGQLEVTGNDPRLLVVTSGVSSQLQHFGGQIFHHSGQVDGGSGSNALSVVALSQQTVDTSNGELKSRTVGTGLGLRLHFSSLSTARHDV